MHSSRIAIVLTCLIAFPAWQARADEADDVFEKLYGLRVRSAKSSRDKADDKALAEELITAARASTSAPKLMTLMCQAAYDLASTHPSGYATAVRAMRMLAAHVPEQRAAADQKTIDLLQRWYLRSRGDEKARVGGDLLDVLVDVAESQAAADKRDDAIATYRRAIGVARTIRSDQLDQITAALDTAIRLQRLDKQILRLKTTLEADPDDAASAEQLVRLYLVELDNPGGAKLFVKAVKDEALRKHATLAAGPLSAINEADALSLGEWYRGVSQTVRGDARGAMLNRARAYFEHYLVLHTQRDAQHVAATLRLKEMTDAMAALGVRPYPLPAGATQATGQTATSQPVGAKVDLIKATIDRYKATGKQPFGEGGWRINNGVLRSTQMAPSARIELAYEPKGDYRLDLRFTRTKGTLTLMLLLPVGAGHVGVNLAGPTGNCGLEMVNGKSITDPANPTATKALEIQNGKEYAASAEVRLSGDKADIRVNVEGKPVIRWSGNQRDLAQYSGWQTPNTKAISVGAKHSLYQFSQITLQRLGGVTPSSTTQSPGPSTPIRIVPHPNHPGLPNILGQLKQQNPALFTNVAQVELVNTRNGADTGRNGRALLDQSLSRRVWLGNDGIKSFIIRAPIEPVPAGAYLAVYRLNRLPAKADESHALCSIEVTNRDSKLASRVVTIGEVPAGKWTFKAFRFQSSQTLTQPGIRVWQSGRPTGVDRFYLFKLSPRNVNANPTAQPTSRPN